MQNINSIKNYYLGKSGQNYEFEYFNCDDFSVLDKSKCTQCYAVCYLQDESGKIENQICIVKNGKKNTWGLIGGTIEKEEEFEKTLKREIQEEGNLKVLKFIPLGYQVVRNLDGNEEDFYQLRYFVIAEKIGEFISDPAESVTEVAFIDPKDVKKYFDWQEIGDEIFKKAAEIFENITHE